MKADIYLDGDRETRIAFFEALEIFGKIIAHEEYSDLLPTLRNVIDRLKERQSLRVSDLLLFFEDSNFGGYCQLLLTNGEVEVVWRNSSILSDSSEDPEDPLTIGCTIKFHKRTGILKLEDVEIWFGNVQQHDIETYQTIVWESVWKSLIPLSISDGDEDEEDEFEEGEVWEPLGDTQEEANDTLGSESLTPVVLMRFPYQSLLLYARTIEVVFNGSSGKILSLAESIPSEQREQWSIADELDLFSRAQMKAPLALSVMQHKARLSIGEDFETPLLERELEFPNGPLGLPAKPDLWLDDFPIGDVENLTKKTRIMWTERHREE